LLSCRRHLEKILGRDRGHSPDKWVSWRRHRVESGDTLTSIAKKYRVTPAAIADANALDRAEALTPGEKLIIPANPPSEEAKSRLVRLPRRRKERHPCGHRAISSA